jgi:hypothetical protein
MWACWEAVMASRELEEAGADGGLGGMGEVGALRSGR